jgi:hypothetical protein
MTELRLDGHKKVLGILYVISAMFTIMVMLVFNTILSFIFSLAFDEVNPNQQKTLELILSIVQYLPVMVILFFSIPTLIAGIGLLTLQRWATIFALIMGCLKLFSFPIGTAIGIYAIWIYIEDQKLINCRSAK